MLIKNTERKLFIDLTPLVPLSLARRGGGNIIKRGEASLTLPQEGRDFREGRSPSLTYTPPFPERGR